MLDDVELIEVLANTKAKAKEVEQKLADAAEKQTEIADKREQYRQPRLRAQGTCGLDRRGFSTAADALPILNAWPSFLTNSHLTKYFSLHSSDSVRERGSEGASC